MKQAKPDRAEVAHLAHENAARKLGATCLPVNEVKCDDVRQRLQKTGETDFDAARKQIALDVALRDPSPFTQAVREIEAAAADAAKAQRKLEEKRQKALGVQGQWNALVSEFVQLGRRKQSADAFYQSQVQRAANAQAYIERDLGIDNPKALGSLVGLASVITVLPLLEAARDKITTAYVENVRKLRGFAEKNGLPTEYLTGIPDL